MPERISGSARRRALFAFLYLSEGAPVGYLWWALPTKLRVAGMPVEQITGLTALLALPWALKMFWAPLVDGLRSRRWGFSSWIVSAQAVMGLTLLPLLFFDFGQVPIDTLTLLLLAHAFAAATQDVAIDGLAITSTPVEEHGQLNGWMQLGFLVGRGLFGGGILLVEDIIGARGALALLLASIWVPGWILYRLAIEDTGDRGASLRRRFREVGSGFLRMLRGPRFWAGVAFAATAGLGFESVGAVAGPYLTDRGFDESEVGLVMGIPVVVAMASGALLGGFVSDRLGRRLSAGLALLALGGAIALLGIGDPSTADGETSTAVRLVLVYLTIGIFTASSYALFMDLTTPAIAATEFAAFMGVTNLCESISAKSVGRLIEEHGYSEAFLTMVALSSLALVPLLFCRPQRKPTASEEAAPEGGSGSGIPGEHRV